MQQQLFCPVEVIPPISETIDKMKSFIFDKWDARARNRFELIKYIPFFVYEYYHERNEIEPIEDCELNQIFDRFQTFLVVMGTRGMTELQRVKFKLIVTRESFMKSYAVILKWEQEYKRSKNF